MRACRCLSQLPCPASDLQGYQMQTSLFGHDQQGLRSTAFPCLLAYQALIAGAGGLYAAFGCSCMRFTLQT